MPGVIVCVQRFGSVAHLHPHLHVLMTECRRPCKAARF
ncbi:MAG: hypothetical protein E6J45_12325 [Chloroflexi bacterium]|nr:MAG: hypothetical protein E6J45_12325 [Chloroflexota bacterium]